MSGVSVTVSRAAGYLFLYHDEDINQFDTTFSPPKIQPVHLRYPLTVT